MSPGNTISAGPGLLTFVYATGRYAAWSAAALAFCDVSEPAVGDGLPNCGCAMAMGASAARTAANARLMVDANVFMCVSFGRNTTDEINCARNESTRMTAIIGIQLGDDFIGFFVD